MTEKFQKAVAKAREVLSVTFDKRRELAMRIGANVLKAVESLKKNKNNDWGQRWRYESYDIDDEYDVLMIIELTSKKSQRQIGLDIFEGGR